MQPKIKVSIIGITGYTGLELLRLALAHPHVEIAYLTSRQHEDAPIGELYPHLAHLDLRVTNTPHKDVAANSDVVFLALPHKTAQDVVADLHGKVKIIDLSADYRLDDTATYEKYYNITHNHTDLLAEVPYGAPEIVGRDMIAGATTVANPGCFALLAQLLLFPFKDQIAQADIMAITGSSGAGKSATEGTHHPVRNHNLKSYNINIHRHIPEITRAGGITAEQLNFVPTSGPFTRGIFATAFIQLKEGTNISPAHAATTAQNIYSSHSFIRIMENNKVAIANVAGSNYAHLSFIEGQGGHIIAQGALDNLVKGAAGAAIQNMNLMCGFDETEGLNNLSPVYP